MKTTPLLVMAALVFLAGLSFIRAEDWTVNGKTYNNVTVSKVDADRVHITYDGGIGAILLSDLPPDLQKKFNYDPNAAAAATAAEKAREQASDAQVAAAAKANQAATASASAAADVASNPMEIFGTISEAKAGYYTVTALGINDILPSGNSVSDVWQMNPKNQKAPKLAMPTGGSCTLISAQEYTVDKFIDIVVYPAGVRIDGSGNKVAQFADDPATAAKLAQGK